MSKKVVTEFDLAAINEKRMAKGWSPITWGEANDAARSYDGPEEGELDHLLGIWSPAQREAQRKREEAEHEALMERMTAQDQRDSTRRIGTQKRKLRS